MGKFTGGEKKKENKGLFTGVDNKKELAHPFSGGLPEVKKESDDKGKK